MHEPSPLDDSPSWSRLFRHLVQTLARPQISEEKPFQWRYLRIVVMVLVISGFFTMIALIIKVWFDNYFGFDTANEELVQQPLIRLMTAGILAPVVEEITFRLPMRFNARNLSVFVAMLIVLFLFGQWINQQIAPLTNNHAFEILARLSVKLLLAALLAFVLYQVLKNFDPALVRFRDQRFTLVFYFFTILFGFAHISNAQYSWHNLLYIIPLTLPQIISGLFLGYTRIKLGLKYAVLQHAIWNLLLVLPLFLK